MSAVFSMIGVTLALGIATWVSVYARKHPVSDRDRTEFRENLRAAIRG